ncbi:hypothetical protein HV454_16305 [Bacillus sporothermodurans]|uniref:TasA family protein n=1 Tax=Heyndrickxia sporothermodurans TaxID=46224 RepID=UPI00192CCABF|nr:TasA family protein [Heyndrickxia sporothermodurans]MBL5769181.1 hypothetical protein [Heyndrickxia sporothermodurans]MBL5787053.1 hypothetical protein [Heyndrickxia sporothermodurans]MBL5878486.1 hypothetical protein [Heyndrickxia sporothermodurans]MBL5910193.1 hypothetical protein [Heyndrickxia sporothermodurans]
MKKIRKWFPLILLVLILLPINHVDAQTSENEINIETSPHKILFDVDNMKPGDWAIRDYTIFNKGKQDFEYTASAQFKSGSKKLFNNWKLKYLTRTAYYIVGKLKILMDWIIEN